MEFSNPDIHSAIVEERIAELQQEASRDHLAQLAHNGQPPDESEVRVHRAGLRGRLGHRLIALGRVIAYSASTRDPMISFRGGYI